jgi:hypothetical protein
MISPSIESFPPTNKPKVLIVGNSEVAKDNIVKDILKSQQQTWAPSSVVLDPLSLQVQSWHIDNKYYTADIEFVFVDSEDLDDVYQFASILSDVDGIIYVFHFDQVFISIENQLFITSPFNVPAGEYFCII